MNIIIEVVTAPIGGSECGAVIVRHGQSLVQTPWLIGRWKEAAQSISDSLRREFPDTPQTHIGFVASGKVLP